MKFLSTHRLLVFLIAINLTLISILAFRSLDHIENSKSRSAALEQKRILRQKIEDEKSKMEDAYFREKEGMVNTAGTPNFSLLEEPWAISSYALKESGVDEAMKPVLQRHIDQTFKAMSDMIASTAVKDEELSKPEEGIVVYNIPASDGSLDIMDKLKSGFENAVGKAKAQLLLSSFHTNNYFGNFGKYETRLKFTTTTNAQGIQETVVDYKYTDPKFAATRGTGRMDMERFEIYFGKSFSFDP